ncbi:DUF3846 domain-containing protein [Cryobacterium lyxosi]|uniref:DUF3846 domain-containing protein n=1 Tax=Cryobacterium lyxosi TaxID=1259228 RepID=A0A4R8ZGI7_9MICO|nr:DUF3846 domain-containing protein [Cryobacterium lyxosi]TFD27349.1 DUF3846 domain-containing protein [Cryobacterium lyxosi]
MVTGIVIPHETGPKIFPIEFSDLASYQAAVGGYIEPVYIENPRITIFANEEGKVQKLPINRRATCLWWLHSPRVRGHDILVGDVALIGSRGGAGSTTSLPADFIELLLETPSYKIEVRTADKPKNWYSNQREFDNYFETTTYALNLLERWRQVCDVRIVAA